MPSPTRAILYVVICNAIWASVGFLIRLTEGSQITFLFWVGVFGLIGSLIKMAVMGDLGAVRQLQWTPSTFLYMLFNGGLGLFIFLAYQDTRVFVAVPSLILNSVVLLVVVLAPLLIKEKTTRKEFQLAFLGFVGLAVFVVGQSIGALDQSSVLLSVGVIFALLALLCNGLGSLQSRQFSRVMPPTAIPLYVSLGDMLVALLAAGGMGISLISISTHDLVLAAIIGLTSVTFCYHILYLAFSQLKVQTVSIIGLGQPVLTAVIGIFLLKEIPNVWMILGGVIVLSAVYQIVERKTGLATSNER